MLTGRHGLNITSYNMRFLLIFRMLGVTGKTSRVFLDEAHIYSLLVKLVL
jgi:hypothetical protein